MAGLSYRTTLSRRWGNGPHTIGWVLLNPSTATDDVDDPTVRKLIGFSKRLRSDPISGSPMFPGAFVLANLFPVRATDPDALHSMTPAERDGPNPLGPIRALIRSVDLVVVAWGENGARYPARVREVREALYGEVAVCLGVTSGGQPRHPVRIGYDTPFVPWPIAWKSRAPSE